MAQVAQTAFAALAFAGAGFLFKSFDSRGDYEKEIERHNHATEELARAKEAFYENQVLKKNKIDEAKRRKIEAMGDISSVNKALDQLKVLNTVIHNGKKFHREPHLNDFYKPSDKMNLYMSISSLGIGAGMGYLAYLFV